MKHAFALATLLLVSLNSSPLFANTSLSNTPLKTVGKAEMRWLMFPLYQISLKTPDGRYQENRFPQVLDITYRRDIDKRDLLTATDQQWQRLGLPQAQRQSWINQLHAIWPTVKSGDQLGFKLDSQGKNYFTYNGKNIGGVADAQFGQSFLAIWLSPKTSQPGIRQRLIGPNS
ncbi:chalcone isomerase family protein [Leucothrix mucor]|uniref:chalcone isomerase family protein n=1 Tax=Leucothrix mucor TaxID=45248 RepID=UPI0003B6B73A|nr:chalcone isomerase family protein [Leucothrix mucor]